MRTMLGCERSILAGTTRRAPRCLLAAALFVAAAVAAKGADRGMPYRVFWHAYRLGQLSDDPGGRLRIVSRDDVDPRTFKFSPRDSRGRELLACDKDGLCEVLWSESFYRTDREISHNQPAGSLTISFNWKASTVVGDSMLAALLINGRRYGESIYHWVALRGEFVREASKK